VSEKQHQSQHQGGGSQPAKKSKRRRRGGGGGTGGGAGGGQKAKRPDLWRPVPQLADPSPITPTEDPTALIRSLGDPPLQGQGAVAEHYLAAVAERAATLATALAASAGLLAQPDAEADEG
jgi:hypothetical protein